jgi:hypothetical protein
MSKIQAAKVNAKVHQMQGMVGGFMSHQRFKEAHDVKGEIEALKHAKYVKLHKR